MQTGDPLFYTVVLLTAGVAGLGAARFAGISPIVGFFVLGALVGPGALGLIDGHSPTMGVIGCNRQDGPNPPQELQLSPIAFPH